jgi:hypothetical protein
VVRDDLFEDHPEIRENTAEDCALLRLLLISSSFDFADALLDRGQLLLYVVLIGLQAFLFLVGGKETTERRAASAAAAAAGATGQGCARFASPWLTHF